MVRETVDEDEAFREKAVSNQQSAISGDQHPARRHGDTEEEADLPRSNADEHGLENPSPIFWKPTPDMYRMDTPEGREAYEESLRVKIKPRAACEPRSLQAVIPPQPAQNRRGPGTPVIPPQPAQNRRGPGTPVIAPEDRSETYANLG